MEINADSIKIAAVGGTTLHAYDVQPGDRIFPNHIVVKEGDGEEYFWHSGGPHGVALRGGTITAQFDRQDQEYRMNAQGNGAVVAELLTGDDILPIPPETGRRINFPPEAAPNNTPEE